MNDMEIERAVNKVCSYFEIIVYMNV